MAPTTELTFSQLLGYAYREIPDFKRSLVLVVVGLIVMIAGWFIENKDYVFIINLVGGAIAFLGFEQLSKVIGALRLLKPEEIEKAMSQK